MNVTPEGASATPGPQPVPRFRFVNPSISTSIPHELAPEHSKAFKDHCMGEWGDDIPDYLRTRNERVLAGKVRAPIVSFHTSSTGYKFAVLTTTDGLMTKLITRPELMCC
jgi:hypothetical protein